MAAAAAVALFISPVVLSAASASVTSALSTYRGWTFGTTVDASLKQLQADPRDVRTVHSRPATIQELEWSPGYTARHDLKDPDPVRSIVMRFHNDRLFQIIAVYARDRVEGLAESDMVEVLSREYGTSTAPGGVVPYSSNYGDVASVVARWQDAEHSANLVRSPDGYSFALVLTARSEDAAARTAIAESLRLDQIDGPRLAAEQDERRAAAEREALDKARSTNKSNFRP